MITLATAHPAKFPDAVERAMGIRPALPPHMADLFDRPERMTRVPNDLPRCRRWSAKGSALTQRLTPCRTAFAS
jgi:threonine synthase